MSVRRLKQKQWLGVSPEEAWDFFSDARNLPRITPDYMKFKIMSDLPEKVYPGLIIHYQLQPIPGIPAQWVTEITQVKDLKYFIDEQRIGPYAFWHHQHHFKAYQQGTEIMDLVHYKLPLGPLGDLAHWLFVKKQLNAIFDFRKQALTEIFGQGKVKFSTT